MKSMRSARKVTRYYDKDDRRSHRRLRAPVIFYALAVAVIGLALFFPIYPACSFSVKRRRQKVGPEIVKLCKELLK